MRKVYLGSGNDEGICWTAYLHVFNQGTWREKCINKKQVYESQRAQLHLLVSPVIMLAVWQKNTGTLQHAFQKLSQSPHLVLPSKVVRSLDQQNK